jgi:uncharacterized protein (DUF4415 family)
MTADDAPDLSSPEYHAKFAAVPARRKAKKPTKAHKITLSLAPDVVASIKASGPGFNRRVEQALREAGFGAAKTKPAKKTSAKRPTRQRNRGELVGGEGNGRHSPG